MHMFHKHRFRSAHITNSGPSLPNRLPRPLAHRLTRMLLTALIGMVIIVLLMGDAENRAVHQMARQDLRENVDNVRGIYANQLAELQCKTAEFAAWDEMLRHVRQRELDWLDYYMEALYHGATETDIAVVVDPSGQIVHSSGGLPGFLEKSAIPDPQLAERTRLLQPFGGLWKWGSYYYLIAGAAMMPASVCGPSEQPESAAGFLISGIRVTREWIGKLEDLSGERLQLCELSGRAAPWVIGPAAAEPDNVATLEGYCVLRNMDGHPCALLNVTSSFPVLSQVHRSFAYVLTATILLGLALTAYMLYQIHQWVLQPVAVLRGALDRFRRQEPVDWPALLQTADEFEQLSDAFGQVTEALHESESMSLRGIIEGSTDAVLVVDAAGRAQMLNAAARLLLLPEPESRTGIPLVDMVRPEQREFAERLWQLRPAQGSQLVEVRIPLAVGAVDSEINLTALGDGRYFVAVRDITQRKQADAALRESEARLRATFDHAGVGIVEANTDSRFIAANDRACEILEYSREDLLGMTVQDLTAPEDRAVSQELNSGLLRGDCDRFDYEKRYLKADGTPLWVHVTVGAVRDEHGRHIRSIATVEDIHERKAAEQALRDSERRFRDLADLLMETVFETDATGRVTFLNRKGCETFGYRRHEVERKMTVPQLLYGDDQARADQELRRLHQGSGHSHSAEYKALRKDGSTFDVMLEVEPVENGADGKGLRGILIDITEQKQAQAAVRESEERFRNLSDSAPVLIWMGGADRHGFYFNRTWRNFTGRSMQAEYGKGWLQGVHPDDLNACLEAYRQAFVARRPYTTEFRLRHTDGTYHWLLDTGTPRFAPDGSFAGFIGTCTDITDRRQAEEAVRESEERFRALFETAQDPIFIKNLQLLYTHVNPAMERMVGLPAARIIGKSDEQLFGPEAAVWIEREDERALRGDVVECESARPVAGATVLLHVVKVPLRNRDGKIVSICGIGRDVTARRQAERRLEEERGLFIGGPTVVFRWRAEDGGPVDYVSPNVQSQFGWEPAELAGGRVRFEDLIHPEDRTWIRGQVESYVKSGVPFYELEYRLRCRDGAYRWVHDFTVVGPRQSSGLAYHHGYILDITDRTVAQNALARNERRYRLLAENVRDIIWSADAELNFTYISPSVERLTGFTVEEALSHRLPQILAPASLEAIADLVAAAPFDRLHPAELERLLRTRELELYCKDGTTLWTEVSMSCLLDETGRVQEILGVTRDITERKRVERAMLEYAAQYRMIAKISPFPLVISRRADGQILFANDHFCRLFHTDPERALKTRTTEFYAEPSQRGPIIDSLAETGRMEGFELRARAADGSTLTVRVSARLFDFDGDECLLTVMHKVERPWEQVGSEVPAHYSHQLEELNREIEDALDRVGRYLRPERHRNLPSV